MILDDFKANFDAKLRGLLAGSMRAFAVKLLSAVSAFLLSVVLARFLGSDQAGYFFLAQAIIIILAIVGRQGFDNALVRFIAGYTVNSEVGLISGVYKYSLIRILPLLVILSLLLWLGSDFISENVFEKPLLSSVLAIGALAILPMSIAQLHGFCFQGKKETMLATLFQSGLLSVLALMIIWGIEPTNANQAMAGYCCSAMIVLAISSVMWNRQNVHKGSPLPDREKITVKESIKPLFTIVVLSQVSQWSGQLMLGVWSSTGDVALFSVAQRTAMLASFILIAVNTIAAPRFAEACKRGDFKEIREISISSGRIMTIVALPFIIFMLIFSEWLMGLFGPSYVWGANILRILAIGQFINVMTGSVGYLLQMTGHEKILKRIFLISTSIMVLGCSIAIPLYGAYGAALIAVLSMTSQNLLCVYQVKKKLGFNTLDLFGYK